jgi:hypothetical protein
MWASTQPELLEGYYSYSVFRSSNLIVCILLCIELETLASSSAPQSIPETDIYVLILCFIIYTNMCFEPYDHQPSGGCINVHPSVLNCFWLVNIIKCRYFRLNLDMYRVNILRYIKKLKFDKLNKIKNQVHFGWLGKPVLPDYVVAVRLCDVCLWVVLWFV